MSAAADSFCVCALFYGDYPAYAERCLGSLVNSSFAGFVTDFRFGLNAVGTKTHDLVQEAARSLATTVPVRIFEPEGGGNIGKYPLMRAMLYDKQSAPLAPYVMWFDDDSWLTDGAPAWWRSARAALSPRRAVIAGDVWRLTVGFRPGQAEGIKRQPWYADKGIPVKPSFVTGGWWLAKTEFLSLWDYPFPELYHNGGDTILGELCRQQGREIVKFKKGVVINDKKRRGIGVARADQYWPWQTGPQPVRAPLPPIVVRTFGGLASEDH